MRKILPIILLLFTLTSCEFISSLIHDDELVARVGNEKLYRDQIKQYIPEYVSAQDSISLANQYIQKWASEILYSQMAQAQLSKEEMDVTEELEAYRNNLLKYRYEQRYVNDRLDTLVTDEQIKEYYEEHKTVFELPRPVLKYKYIDLAKLCPDKDYIVKLLSSDREDDSAELDTLASMAALDFSDHSEQWTDIIVLAKAYGVPYQELMNNLKNSYISIKDPVTEEEKVAYVFEMRQSGYAPLDYCREEIKSIIQSTRKHMLLSTLEQDLLNDAMENKKFVIY